MRNWLKKADSLDGEGGSRLAVFTFGLFGLGLAILGVDVAVTASTMRADEHGYPVRLIIPRSMVEIAQRPPPVLLGENVELISAALAERAEQGSNQAPHRKLKPGEFNRAFGITPDTQRTVDLAAPPKPGKNGMIEVSFDLEGGAQSAKAISVDKPVAIGGTNIGSLAIRIDGAAQIFADRWQVAAMIDETDAATANKVRTASGEDYLSFRQLRDLGVNIRYDPAADRIVIPLDG